VSVSDLRRARAAGRTLYVAAGGDDAAGDGSGSRPFRQIRRALALAVPGDTVLVGDGDYLGFDVEVTATAAAPLIIKAQASNARILPTTDRADNRDTIHVLHSSFVVIEGLRSFGANRAALRVDASDHTTVRNCVFGDNARWGLFTNHSDDLLIESNECYGSVAEHGIYVSNSGDRPVVRGNRLHDNRGAGVQLNADLSAGGDGIISGALLENNVIYNNGAGGGGAINLDGVHDSIVRNNLLFNNHASGITNFQIDGAAGPRGMQILHNTIDMAADGRWAILISSSTGANVVRNNILYNRHSFRGGLLFRTAADAANTDSDYNVLDRVSSDDGNTSLTLAQWQAAGHEAHSLSASPTALFVNAAAIDYHLAANSPAVDRGQTLGGVALDLEGRARPRGASSDIGCYEFAPAGANPIDAPEFFVRQHYMDFFNREPDAPGLAFWTNEIASCGADASCIERKRINVSAAFFLSIEFQETGYLVQRFYVASYGRRPAFAEFLPDTQATGQNVIVGNGNWEAQLEQNKRAFAESFVMRPAFVAQYPATLTPEQYVDALNANTGGALSQAERNALVAGLKGGTETRATVLRGVAENRIFYEREFNRAFVQVQYFGYLRRDPDEAGYQFWLAKLNAFGGNYVQAEMVKAFISSTEYRSRFEGR
jgi:hypothetical protein